MGKFRVSFCLVSSTDDIEMKRYKGHTFISRFAFLTLGDKGVGGRNKIKCNIDFADSRK
jgi:hypothetical protein